MIFQAETTPEWRPKNPSCDTTVHLAVPYQGTSSYKLLSKIRLVKRSLILTPRRKNPGVNPTFGIR
jgi:hypothetical protein